MAISHVTKYKLKEILFTIITFLVFFTLNILVSGIEDFPFLKIVVATIILTILITYYDTSLRKKMDKYFSPPVQIVAGILFIAMIFLILPILFLYSEQYFEHNIAFTDLLDIDLLGLLPPNFLYSFIALFMFLSIRFMISKMRTRSISGTFKNFFFKKPGETISDVRIFMFMDLISSTSYAEKLGYSKYSRFIQDIYYELDEYVLLTKGSIYQYVGDEVVLIWKYKDGISNANCLRFFFLFKERLEELEKYFLNKYGVFPKFRAGFHFGEVAIVEVGGILRRDFVFHGDVVNTTSRICSKCKQLNENILLSKELADELNEDKELDFESVGQYQLKGKAKETELYRINENQN